MYTSVPVPGKNVLQYYWRPIDDEEYKKCKGVKKYVVKNI
jgi:hypothetical protein